MRKQFIYSLLIAVFILVPCYKIKAQNNLLQKNDTIQSWKLKHSIKKAATYSTFVPGLGQLYNRKPWKVPIVYGGFYTLFYAWNYNNTRYKKFHYASVSFPSTLTERAFPFNGRYYTIAQLNKSASFYKKYRTLSLIGLLEWYTLNILDASIDAYSVQYSMLSDQKYHSPQRAALLSAAIPGLGQFYNKRFAWIKVPAIYGGFTGLYIAWKYNNDYFTLFNDVYNNIPANAPVDSNYFVGNISRPFLKDNIYKQQEYFRHWKDLNIIFMGLLYMLNIIDATVSAYMYSYDISNDLSIRIQPQMIDLNSQYYGSAFPVGVKMTFNF